MPFRKDKRQNIKIKMQANHTIHTFQSPFSTVKLVSTLFLEKNGTLTNFSLKKKIKKIKKKNKPQYQVLTKSELFRKQNKNKKQKKKE